MKRFVITIALTMCIVMIVCVYSNKRNHLTDDLVSYQERAKVDIVENGDTLNKKGKTYKGIMTTRGDTIYQARYDSIRYDENFAWGITPKGQIDIVRVKDHRRTGPFNAFLYYPTKKIYEGTYLNGNTYYYIQATGTEIITPAGYLYKEGTNHFFYTTDSTKTKWTIAMPDGKKQVITNPVAIVIDGEDTHDVFAYVIRDGDLYKGYCPSFDTGVEPGLKLSLNERDWRDYVKQNPPIDTVYGCQIINLTYNTLP